MRRFALVSSLIIGVGIIPSILQTQEPEAQATAPVYCVNCGTEMTQLLGKLTMAKQLATQAQQLQTQISQYQNMVLNSKLLPTQIWNNAMQDFQQLSSIMHQSQALGYATKDLATQFASQYGTFSSYKTQNMSFSGWMNKLNQWSKQGSDNAKYTLQGLGVQAFQLQKDQAALQKIQALANSSTGQMQALQAGNQMASQNISQLMQLRELIMMQSQMQANYLAQQQDRQAASDAAAQKLFNFQLLPYKTGKTYQ